MTTTRKLNISHGERTCCGVVEEVRERRANRKNGQPWIILKLMIVFTLGIMGYSAYVYISRLCVKMINRRNGAGGSRGAGSEWVFVASLWPVWTPQTEESLDAALCHVRKCRLFEALSFGLLSFLGNFNIIINVS